VDRRLARRPDPDVALGLRRRFTELVAEPAMSYVTRWRMHLAAAALRDEGATVAALAERFGYRSEAAFARAFKRVIGRSPGALRRAGLAESIAA
jgi:AraC-like DNA-binding protein